MLRNIFGDSLDSDIETIRMLRRLGQPIAIPSIAPILCHADANMRREADEAIARLLTFVRPQDVLRIDQRIRPTCREFQSVFREACARELTLRLLKNEFTRARLAMASMHADGRVRLAAVEQLADYPNVTKSLPFLLVRCNDWVGSVREAAVRAVTRLIDAPNVSDFIDNLYLIDRLQACGRADHSRLIALMYRLVKAPHAASQLLGALQHDDCYVRRASFRMLVECDHIEPEAICEAAGASCDPIVRMRSLRLAIDRLDGAPLHDFLSRALADANMPNRRIALQAMVANFPQSACSHVSDALFDHHPSMRLLARFEMGRRDPDFDCRAAYLAGLSATKTKTLASAIAGVGECGVASDSASIVGFLDHPRFTVRSETLRALFALEPERYRSLVLNNLTDPSILVVRTAEKLIGKKPREADFARLTEILASTNVATSIVSVLRLVGRFRNWTAAAFLMSYCRNETQWVADAASDIFWNSWRRRMTYVPYGTAVELNRAEAVLRQLVGLRPDCDLEAVRADIRFARSQLSPDG